MEAHNFIAARALATYLIPGCVGRGVRLGSEGSSGGATGGGGVWKSGDLEIWEFGDLGTWNGNACWEYKMLHPTGICKYSTRFELYTGLTITRHGDVDIGTTESLSQWPTDGAEPKSTHISQSIFSDKAEPEGCYDRKSCYET